MSRPKPTDLLLHQQSRTLEVVFDTGEKFQLPWEYLRVFSPSAEVRGRRGSGRILVLNKQQVKLTEIRPIGNYAVKLFFDDGHNSGLFDWAYLYELGKGYEQNWSIYQAQVANAGDTDAISR